jgi:hypothetical protein
MGEYGLYIMGSIVIWRRSRGITRRHVNANTKIYDSRDEYLLQYGRDIIALHIKLMFNLLTQTSVNKMLFPYGFRIYVQK